MKNVMSFEEFIEEKGKGLELMKKIKRRDNCCKLKRKR